METKKKHNIDKHTSDLLQDIMSDQLYMNRIIRKMNIFKTYKSKYQKSQKMMIIAILFHLDIKIERCFYTKI